MQPAGKLALCIGALFQRCQRGGVAGQDGAGFFLGQPQLLPVHQRELLIGLQPRQLRRRRGSAQHQNPHVLGCLGQRGLQDSLEAGLGLRCVHVLKHQQGGFW
ncbi:hypothetical protein P3T32_001288 [Ralstonia sp. GP73]|uniref:Secreted protein n=1 Tax=Ralstonia thomasii TaxID=3058596 RepID=A0ABM9J8B6_9RALS|nr:hypothetical protein [Ralstonia sp. GP73]CAJ0717350.1 hypothetical protein LMG7143_04030 [Ralstonia sp. LMG 18095]CAJ0786089.1 hypothetical protein LMG18095_01400 [Ralstonia sp. LMG 18095]